MRLSRLVFAVSLLVSVIFFVQPSHGASGTSSGGSATSSSSASSSSGASHGGSSGGSASSANSHSSGAGAGGSHVGSTGSSRSNSSSARAAHGPSAAQERAQERKIVGEPRNVVPEKRSFLSRLWHPLRKSKPVESAELRRPPCRKEPCAVCPPGESPTKGGCVAPVVANNQCEAGQTWNGSACAGNGVCRPGEVWNGVACVANGQNCATLAARAEVMGNELRGIRSEMERVCRQDPNGAQCRELTSERDGAVLRYRSLLNEAPVGCRVTMPDPLSF